MFLTERDDENENEDQSNLNDTKFKKIGDANDNDDQLSHNLSQDTDKNEIS
jgi:hypothetical protein